MPKHRQTTVIAAIRVGWLGAAAGIAGTAVVAWVRPTALAVRGDDPTSAIVLAAAWALWALAGYLLLATMVVAAARMPGLVGRGARLLAPAAPRAVRLFVATAAGGAVALGTTAATAAPVPPHPGPPHPAPASPAPSLDWPVAPPATAPADVAAPVLVVRRGDSLWSLTARLLPAGAGAARIAATWPRLYAANRAVIGANPDLIHPGQRLTPPRHERTPR